MRKRGRKKPVAFFLLIGLIVCRICYINSHTPLTGVLQISQGDTLNYQGMEYTVASASLLTYDDFFLTHPELVEYRDEGCLNDKAYILLVDYLIEKKDDDAILRVDMPIRYAYEYNGVDPFMIQDLNPTLQEGTFSTGDILTIPYELYRINLSPETWDAISKLNMTYVVVMSSYPTRIEMLITDIEKGELEHVEDNLR